MRIIITIPTLILGMLTTSTSSVLLNQSDPQVVLESPGPMDHGRAGLPVPNPTRSFWIDTPGANPLAREGSEGPLTSEADICIIGSGMTGISAAYHLSRSIQLEAKNNTGLSQVSVVILEARDFCSGATGRNGGHLTPATFFDFRNLQERYGTDQVLRSFALENHTISGMLKIIDEEKVGETVDLIAGGHVGLLSTEKEVLDAKLDLEAARGAGLNLDDVEWLSREYMKTKYGVSYPGIGRPGHNFWPLKFVTHLYTLAKSKSSQFSLNLHTHTPVTSVTPTLSSDTSSRRWTLTTPRGPIACSHVVHATNAYASHLLPHMQGPTGIIPTRGQVIALRAAAPLSELTKASWDGNGGWEYWFPRPVERSEQTGKELNPLVILGGGRDASKPRFELYEVDDSVVNTEVGRALKDFLPALFPGHYEQGREPEMEWTGIMGYTTLKAPFVGPVIDKSHPDLDQYKGQFIAAGYTGHGMPQAFSCAEVVAQMVLSEITGKSWNHPEWLPERYLTWAREM